MPSMLSSSVVELAVSAGGISCDEVSAAASSGAELAVALSALGFTVLSVLEVASVSVLVAAVVEATAVGSEPNIALQLSASLVPDPCITVV